MKAIEEKPELPISHSRNRKIGEEKKYKIKVIYF